MQRFWLTKESDLNVMDNTNRMDEKKLLPKQIYLCYDGITLWKEDSGYGDVYGWRFHIKTIRFGIQV